jgi:hypothetical protein
MLNPIQPNNRILAHVLPNQKQTRKRGNKQSEVILLAEVSKADMIIAEPVKIEVV